MPPKVKQRSALSERLLKLHAETNLPEPCELPNGVVIQPLTRTRMGGLHDAELKKYFLQQTLAHRIGLVQSPPKLPEAPILPEGATDEQRAEHDAAVKVQADQYAADIAKYDSLPEDINELSKQINRADDDWYKAFFGDSYAAVMDFFEDKPELWEEFMPEIKAEFLPATPDTGVCATCGHVKDEEAAGKAPEPST